jgi:hypothetical protein
MGDGEFLSILEIQDSRRGDFDETVTLQQHVLGGIRRAGQIILRNARQLEQVDAPFRDRCHVPSCAPGLWMQRVYDVVGTAVHILAIAEPSTHTSGWSVDGD